MKAAVFRDAAAARAAFALGRVRYRCWVCGKVHVSGSGAAEKCLSWLANSVGWRRVVGPLPAQPWLPPSLAFARAVWRKGVAGLWPREREVRAGEYVLALDGLDGSLLQTVEAALEEAEQQVRKVIGQLWRFRDEFCRWVRDLSGERPPAAVLGQKLTQAPYGLVQVGAFTVRPAVPPPAGSPEVEVDARDVWEQVVAAGEVEAPWAMRDLLLEIRSRVRQGHLADRSAI